LAILVRGGILVHERSWHVIHGHDDEREYVVGFGPRWTFNIPPTVMPGIFLSVSDKLACQFVKNDTKNDTDRLSFDVTGSFPSIGHAVRETSGIDDVDPNGYVYVCEMAEGMTANFQSIGELAFLARHLNRTLVLPCVAVNSRTTPCPEVYVNDGPVQPYLLYIDIDALRRATGAKVTLYWPYRRSVTRRKVELGLDDDGLTPCDRRRSCEAPSRKGGLVDTSLVVYLAKLAASFHHVTDSDAGLFGGIIVGKGSPGASEINRHSPSSRFPHTIAIHSYWKQSFMWPGFYYMFPEKYFDELNNPSYFEALRYFRDGIVYAREWVELVDRIETMALNIPQSPSHRNGSDDKQVAFMPPSSLPKPYFVFHWRSETVFDNDMWSCARRLIRAINWSRR
jgi:hypothetical protein